MSDISSLIRNPITPDTTNATKKQNNKNVQKIIKNKSGKSNRSGKRSDQHKDANVDYDALDDQNVELQQQQSQEIEEIFSQNQIDKCERNVPQKADNPLFTDDENDEDLPDSPTNDSDVNQTSIITEQNDINVQELLKESICDPNFKLHNYQNDINKSSSSNKHHKEKTTKCLNKFSFMLVVVSSIIAILAIFYLNYNSKTTTNDNYPKICNYTQSRKIKPIQSDVVWETLKTGIDNIINVNDDEIITEELTKLLVLLFTYKRGSEAPALIKKIANESNECFGNSMNVVEMTRDDFTRTDDYGFAIEIFKNRIQEGNVMLIAHLNEIPAEAARALHYICDTYNPLVKNIVIFLTLETFKSNGENPKKTATEILNELWSSLNDNELNPLIVRVTDQVIHLDG